MLDASAACGSANLGKEQSDQWDIHTLCRPRKRSVTRTQCPVSCKAGIQTSLGVWMKKKKVVEKFVTGRMRLRGWAEIFKAVSTRDRPKHLAEAFRQVTTSVHIIFLGMGEEYFGILMPAMTQSILNQRRYVRPGPGTDVLDLTSNAKFLINDVFS